MLISSPLRNKVQSIKSINLRKFGSPYLGNAQQPQEQRYPFLSVCTVLKCSCVQTAVWLTVSGMLNVRKDADACEGTRGFYGHRTDLSMSKLCVNTRMFSQGSYKKQKKTFTIHKLFTNTCSMYMVQKSKTKVHNSSAHPVKGLNPYYS